MIQCIFSLSRCVNHYISTEDDCTFANGTFYYLSDTKEKCLSYEYCWSPQSIVTGLLLPLNEAGECSEGERKQSLFQWRESEWIGGTWAFTNWTKRKAIQANAIKMTLNFTLLQSVVSSPFSISLKTSLQNQVRMKLFCNLVD